MTVLRLSPLFANKIEPWKKFPASHALCAHSSARKSVLLFIKVTSKQQFCESDRREGCERSDHSASLHNNQNEYQLYNILIIYLKCINNK